MGDVDKSWRSIRDFSLPEYLAYLRRIERADERTRTADLISLRVIHQALLGVAWGCKSPISNGFSFPWLALCCTVLRSRWCQEYLDHASPLPSQTGSATELISAPSRLEQ